MSALRNLIIAGVAAAFVSAPALASDRLAKQETPTVTAQETCTGWGVHCEAEVTPEFCIADGKCAVALPAAALVRYDQRMDAASGH
jgi:invasion protein IalB